MLGAAAVERRFLAKVIWEPAERWGAVAPQAVPGRLELPDEAADAAEHPSWDAAVRLQTVDEVHLRWVCQEQRFPPVRWKLPDAEPAAAADVPGWVRFLLSEWFRHWLKSFVLLGMPAGAEWRIQLQWVDVEVEI